jgi:hypothetical protein
MIIDDSYIKNRALNQSLLKKLNISPQLFLKRLQEQEGHEVPDEDEPSENIMMGDACDLILTQGEDKFNEQFVVSNVTRPSPQVAEYCWNLCLLGDPVLAHQKLVDAGAKVSLSALQNKYEKENGEIYYESLVRNKDKKILTEEQYSKVGEVVSSLRYNEFVNKYFNLGKDWYNHYQVELNFEYDGEPCKGLMDLIHVDHISKKIHPIDLKVTESGTDSWEWLFWKMRYDFQCSFYVRGILTNPPDCIKNLKGYTLEPFSFVVESFKYPGSPIEHIVTQEVQIIGEFGGKVGNKTYKGFAEAIKKFKWHTETGIWHYPMDVYLNGGKKWLKI